MIKFKMLKAEEYCDSVRDGTHDSPKKVKTGFKLITSKHIKEYGLDLDNAYYISEKDFKKVNERSAVDINDILYSMIGTIGLMYRVESKPNYAIKNMGLFKVSDETKSKWLYYYLKSPKMKSYIQSLLNGSTQQYITLSNLRQLPIELPENENDMKNIIRILDVIDKKIKLNVQTNDNLLDLIKTLYIEKIKNNNDINFEEKTLDEFCNIFTGKKNANASEENGQFKFFTCAPEPLSINSYIYDGPAVIVAGNGAYTGRTNFYNGKFDLYQRTYGITTNNDYIYLFYAMIYTDLQNDIMGGTHGSAIPYIVMNDIAKFKVKYNKELFDELSQEMKVLLLKIKSNEAQNETLTQLRDTLLPKLMNGEIDLDKIEI